MRRYLNINSIVFCEYFENNSENPFDYCLEFELIFVLSFGLNLYFNKIDNKLINFLSQVIIHSNYLTKNYLDY